MSARTNIFATAMAALTLALPAFAQSPTGSQAPAAAWPAGLQWRDLSELRRSAPTRFGELTVTQSGGGELGNPRRTEVALNGEVVSTTFIGDHSLVFVVDVVPLQARDIVVFSAGADGSGAPPPLLHLLPIGPAGVHEMVSVPSFRSADWTQRIAASESRIFFDLGFERDLRKAASFGADGLTVDLLDSDVTQLASEDCYRLYSIVGSRVCIANQSLSLASDRWLSQLDHHPAFERQRFQQACGDAESTGSPPLFDWFQDEVCRAQSRSGSDRLFAPSDVD